MKGGKWQRAWSVFEDVVELPEAERGQALVDACGDDRALFDAVRGLLEADSEDQHLLDRPLMSDGTLGETTAVGGLLGSRMTRGDAELESGAMVGPYRIVRLLAEGGMGAVYLAVRADESFDRRVVLKLVRADMESSQILERLRKERRILAALDHPYISRLYDGGRTESGRPYFVLEYIEGQPIDVYCREQALSVDERLELFVKVCTAVQFAHRNLVVHRDLKPANILVTEKGDPKLLDFGIAKLINPDLAGDAGEPTDVLMRIATPNYASPEQLRGEFVSTASDVYSLGVLLYLLLADHLPYSFSGLTLAEINRRLSSSTPVPPSVALSTGVAERSAAGAKKIEERPAAESFKVGRDLDAIVLKALRTVPRQRYDSPEQMAEDIERYRQGLPVEAHAGDWRYRLGKLVRRRRKSFAAAAMVGLVLIGFTVAFALQARRVAAERDAALLERDKKSQVLSLMVELFQLSSPYVAPGEELTVREAVDRSVGLLAGSLAEQPEIHAELHYNAGILLVDLGASDEARALLEQSLELQRGVYPSGAPVLADTVSALAGSYKALGELDRAEELARQSIDLARSAAAEASDPRVAAGLLSGPINELVSVLCYRSEYAAAEEPAREALALTRSLPASVPQAIVALEHLSKIRSAAGDYKESVRFAREAVALRRERYGEMHPGQLGLLNNLGTSLRRMDELEAAEQTYEEALELYRHNFGDRDTTSVVPALLNNLAVIAFSRQNYERALELYREAERLVVETIGPEHWMSFHFRVRLARSRMAAGELSAAEDLRRQLTIWSPRLGADHWRIAEARGLLGDGLSQAQRCAEAEPLLVESFENLVTTPKSNVRTEALARLERHFSRCGDPAELQPFADRLAEIESAAADAASS